MKPATQATLSEDEVLQYLLNTPDFFERHASLLAAVQLGSPHDPKTVNLHERQTALLRDKIRGLEWKLAELIRHGQENTTTADKLHRWSRELLRIRQTRDLPAAAARSMASQFIISQVSIKLWDVSPQWANEAFAQGVDAALVALTQSLTRPYCGSTTGERRATQARTAPVLDAASLQTVLRCLDESGPVASLALMALRTEDNAPPFGLLILASGDAHRFTPDMGTDFLERLADVASAALSRLRPD